MFLALREIRRARLRYLLIVAIMTLIAWLVFLLTGMANGLASDNAGAFVNMNTDYLLFQENSGFSPRRSLLEYAEINEIEAISGVEAAAPLGLLSVSVNHGDSAEYIDVTVFGVEPDSFLMPEIVDGQPIPNGATNQVVIDRSVAEDYGIQIGDELQIVYSDRTLLIVGFTENQKYSHMPVAFTDLHLWQEMRFDTPESSGGFENPVNAIALKMSGDTADTVKEALDGTELATRQEAVQNVPGYSEEAGTLQMIQVFLFLIAALIMTVFFYVITMQKTSQFGILKAVGASTRYLAGSLLLQVLMMSLAGIIIGGFLTYTVASVLPTDVPFKLDNMRVLLYGAGLLIVAMLGTYLSLRRIAHIDPLIAIGRQD